MSTPIYVTESTPNTALGSGATLCLMARHEPTGTWIGVRGWGVWP